MKTKIPFILVAILTSTDAFADDSGLPDNRGPNVAPAVISVGTCAGNRVSYATNDAIGDSTTSVSFVDVPGMSRVINIPGTGTTCIAINYSATVFTAPNELMFVRATVDGNQCLPGEVQFDGDSDEDNDFSWARAHAFNFVCQNVRPGNHTVRIQNRSSSGGIVYTHWRSMLIHHR
jgi:hypothetical protein